MMYGCRFASEEEDVSPYLTAHQALGHPWAAIQHVMLYSR